MNFLHIPVLPLLLLLGFSQKGTDAVSSLVASGGVVSDSFLQVCPGTTVNLTCSHDSTGVLSYWVITPALSMDCNNVISHTTTPNSEGVCGPFDVTMISAGSEVTRRSTLELAVSGSLGNRVVTCFAGSSITDPQVGNYTVQVVDPPSIPTAGSIMYSVTDTTTGQVTFEAGSTGVLGTGVSYSGSVVGGGGSLSVDGNRLTVTGLNYTESHTVSVVATSVVCPGVLNSSSSDIVLNFMIGRPILTAPTGYIDCTNPLLPISGSWKLTNMVQNTSDSAVLLTPPPINTTVTYTTAEGRSGSAEFVPDFSYQLTDSAWKDVYTFTVTVTNEAGATSQVSAGVTVSAFTVDTSTVASRGCLTFTVSPGCSDNIASGDFAVVLTYGVGQCQSVTDLRNPTHMTAPITSSSGVCIDVGTMSFVELCYTAVFMYRNTVIMTQTNLDIRGCEVSTLQARLGSGVTLTLSSTPNSNGTVPHTTMATLGCDNGIMEFSGVSQGLCVDSVWTVGSNSCSIAGWLLFVIVLMTVIVLVAIVLITGTILYCCVKRMSLFTSPVDPNPHELGHVYEDPDDVKPDPRTRDNLAYGHVQQSTELRGVIYEEPEDIKPDPQTQGNMAYGHVQFRQ